MNYQTFLPHPDLAPLVKCYWTLEVPAQPDTPRQRIVPDGCIEMAFILGDDIKRFTSGDDFILQPRAMILGQTIEPFFIQPTGHVNTFAVRFYPYGFANFVSVPIKELANKETPIEVLFEKESANTLEHKIRSAASTSERIALADAFLSDQLKSRVIIDNIVKSTIDKLFTARGSTSISTILKDDPSKRRQLERKFLKQVGMSPKQLGKVIRLQTALNMLLHQQPESLTQIAYESEYYDQAHFIKDFKEFTGTTPKDFQHDDSLLLSSLFYAKD
ncbi:MAG: AraC family transcriptional regulator [Cyclobacteriaceae bacterium]|nr:AraC family transcriptional regulator [Cyclobacteriaceae bacterium]